MLMQVLGSTVTGSVVMNDITVTHTRPSPQQSTAGIADDRDGTQERKLGSIWSTLPGGEWWSEEPDIDVGIDFEVKFRKVSGRSPDAKSGWTDNVWTGFISTRHFYEITNDSGTPSTRTAVVEIQIRDKATETLQGSMEATLNAVLS